MKNPPRAPSSAAELCLAMYRELLELMARGEPFARHQARLGFELEMLSRRETTWYYDRICEDRARRAALNAQNETETETAE